MVVQLFKAISNELYNTLPADLACAEEIEEPTGLTIFLPLITSPIDPDAPVPTPTPVPTATPIPTQTPTPEPAAKVELVRIVYNPDGDDVEGESVEISNAGNVVADMSGWVIEDEAGIQFTFPAFSLNPASSVSVWVKTGTNDSGNLYWNRGSSV